MLAIGCDHRGYKLKEQLKEYFKEKDIKVKDFGTFSEERMDYPTVAVPVCKAVQSKECEKGILICGTGFGMAMVANKFKGIRSAACYSDETTKEAKAHSNVNVLAIPADYVDISEAVVMIRTWLGTEFLCGRYLDRVRMIDDIEAENMK